MGEIHQSVDVCFEAVRARGDKGIALLLGAGCSFSSGIPLARGFVDIIRAAYPERCQCLKRSDSSGEYELATSILSDGEWRDLFGRIVNEARLNVAHLCIAELFDLGIVNRVLTTNFDSLLVRSCALGRKFPLIHDCAVADELDDWVDEAACAIFYLHGVEHGRKMLNPSYLKLLKTNAAALQAAGSSLAPDIAEDRRRMLLRARAAIVSRMVIGTTRRQPLVVCGYSGDSDEVFRELQSADELNYPVFWISHSLEDEAKARAQFDRVQNRVFVIYREGGLDADQFFYELLSVLGKNPPQTFQRHGLGEIAARLQQQWETRTSPQTERGPSPRADAFATLTVQKEVPQWQEFSS